MTFTKIDKARKVSETDTHVFFLNGPLSQWYPSQFTDVLEGVETEFHCCEQYMMARKAILFNDTATLQKIMEVRQTAKWQDAPRRCKELGREVSPFDPKVWNDAAQEIVYNGNLLKFSQNADLKDYLLATGDKFLVEGAWYDKVWGVGLAWDDPKIIDPANWQGANWLGEAEMKVRKVLRHG